MILKFTPIRMDKQLSIHVSGDIITLNGEDFDFTPLPNGATLPNGSIDCEWISGDVTRDNFGVIDIHLILPHGSNAPYERRFPESIEITSGVVELPPYDIIQESTNE